MWKVSIIGFILFIFINSAFAQEICNNGIDDDGDGLTDLYDDECLCNGIVINDNQDNNITNPDFESFSPCPTSHSQINYAVGWDQGNETTSDYHNTCGYVYSALPFWGLLPFPSGNGCVGTKYLDNWKEYIATCLVAPLTAGNEYDLSFQIASCNTTGDGDPCGPINYGPVNVTLFGYTDCNFPVAGDQCPESEGWVELGSVYYSPVNQWADESAP
ncbi:MAG: hypothetical protein K9I85_14635 [Saprospiraceae bacterium]|nr:hypothetical protein [Saprospiraceae bacterium]